MKTTLTEPWTQLVAKHGTIENVIRLLGVSRRTFFSWAHGERVPGAAGKRLLDIFFEAHDLTPPTWGTTATPAGTNPATSTES